MVGVLTEISEQSSAPEYKSEAYWLIQLAFTYQEEEVEEKGL
jgi:hypothetical protein